MHAWDQPAEVIHEIGSKSGVPLVMPLLGQPVEPGHRSTAGSLAAARGCLSN
jgi:hypothetical protein